MNHIFVIHFYLRTIHTFVIFQPTWLLQSNPNILLNKSITVLFNLHPWKPFNWIPIWVIKAKTEFKPFSIMMYTTWDTSLFISMTTKFSGKHRNNDIKWKSILNLNESTSILWNERMNEWASCKRRRVQFVSNSALSNWHTLSAISCFASKETGGSPM